jgi:hypothetical protein
VDSELATSGERRAEELPSPISHHLPSSLVAGSWHKISAQVGIGIGIRLAFIDIYYYYTCGTLHTWLEVPVPPNVPVVWLLRAARARAGRRPTTYAPATTTVFGGLPVLGVVVEVVEWWASIWSYHRHM